MARRRREAGARRQTRRRRSARRVAAIALLAGSLLPAQAGAQEAPGSRAGAFAFDAVVLRPLGTVATVVGFVAFVPAAVLSCPGGLDPLKEAWETFVSRSAESTFRRPLGEF